MSDDPLQLMLDSLNRVSAEVAKIGPSNAQTRSAVATSNEETRKAVSDAHERGRHGPRDRLLILLMFRHGLKVSEAIGLRPIQDYLGHRDPRHTAHYTKGGNLEPMGPFSVADRGDAVWLRDDFVPSFAAVVEDVVIALEDAV